MEKKDEKITKKEEVTETKTAAVTPQKESSAPSMGTKRFDSTFNELKAIQSTVRSFKFTDLLIPLLSLISLILLSIFVYIPMVTSGIESMQDNKVTKGKIASLKELGNTLSSIDQTMIQDDLLSAQSVIPYSLQVSDFVSYVDDLAKANGLKFKEILAGDILVKDTGTSKGVDSVMKGVSGPVKYSGSLSQIVEFLDTLQTTSPFILSADVIQIESKANTSVWDVSLNITGYYLDKNKIEEPNIYAKFTPYNKYSDIVQTFARKAQSLNK